MNETIMLCLEKLDIGGVETAVVTQALALKEKGYNIVILSKDGVYTKKLQEHGIICINFDFTICNYWDFDKSKEIIDIFEKYKVVQVHINQFPILLSVLPACLIKKVPFVAYMHIGISYIGEDHNNVFDYYENNFPIFRSAFKLLFKYANKIICITQSVQDYIIKRYKISNNDCKVLPNSINFNTYKTSREVKELNKFLIISRLSKEKEISIFNAIDLYVEFCKYKNNSSCKLDIVGTGNSLENIKKYIKSNEYENYNINFLGSSDDMPNLIEQYDVVIGQGRSLIESIAMKKIVIISGTNSIKGIVDIKNINEAIAGNFSGNNLTSISYYDISKQLLEIDYKKIKNIVNENYNVIKKFLSIYDNIYIIPEDMAQLKVDKNDVIQMLASLMTTIKELENEKNKIWNDYIEYKQYMENIENNIKTENKNLRKEIDNIYNSKRWKLISSIIDLTKNKEQ